MAGQLELFIFDLDGVIADTEPLHRISKLRIFDKLGVTSTVDLDRHVGRPNVELWSSVIDENGLVDKTPKELERMQYDLILEQLAENRATVTDRLHGLLDALADAGVRCALCSSSDRYYVDRVLAFFGYAGRFSPVVGGDEVAEKKPSPDGYLKVLRDAGVDASRAAALEDTSAGVAAAVAAGLTCIGYANPTSGNQDLSRATMRVNGLAEVIDWVRDRAAKR